MKLIDALIDSVSGSDEIIQDVCIGLHWISVSSRFTGMAHTYKEHDGVELEDSGNLIGKSAIETAKKLKKWNAIDASVGLAALNSLIHAAGENFNINQYLIERSLNKTVTIAGRFPFNSEIARTAKKAYFLEMAPEKGELPSFASEDVIPQSDVIVISATALINKSLERLLEISRGKECVVLGPSTPMNDVLFGFGATVVAGVRVLDKGILNSSLMQGVKSFRKIKGIEPVVRFSPHYS
jgi:uncharacterized protein (DUF4213/DUF364 family)